MLSPDYGYKPYETLYLSTLGRNRQVLKDILEEGWYSLYHR